MFKLPEEMESKYRFVTLASLRAEQLQAGALPRVAGPARKATLLAQEEVARGLVEPYDPALEAELAATAAEEDELDEEE
jgi:DNA-directed RNA polymerase subunit K/omega